MGMCNIYIPSGGGVLELIVEIDFSGKCYCCVSYVRFVIGCYFSVLVIKVS